MAKASKRKRRAKSRASNEAPLDQLLGPPPLVGGEDSAAYEELLERVTDEVEPQGIIEQIWVRDVADITFDIFRLRRVRSRLITTHQISRYKPMFLALYDSNAVSEVLEQWANCVSGADEYFDALAKVEPNATESGRAEAVQWNIKVIERIDTLIMNAEIRRNAVIREIDRRRVHLAQVLRDAIKIQDAEFRVLEGPSTQKARPSSEDEHNEDRNDNSHSMAAE